MPNRTLPIAIAAALICALLFVGYYFLLRSEPVVEATPEPEEEVVAPSTPEAGLIEGDQPGPYLTIDVDGQAQGQIVIDLFAENAPKHVEQITALAKEGLYDSVAFHRVIDGFMAQTGDVQFGRMDGDMSRVGMGGSERDDIEAEFSDIPFDRGIVGMARSQSPNSANSQFFIMFDEGHFLNGQYTVVGIVTEGLETLDTIKLGEGPNGSVLGDPDQMVKVEVSP